MPANSGQRAARTKRAARRSDDETPRSGERSGDREADGSEDREDREEERGQARGRDRNEDRTAGELDVAAVAQEGKRLIAAVTGKESEGVTSVEPTDTGWVIEVEVLEDKHIPSSSDVLALYEIEVDPDGTLLSYRRTERYTRGRGNGGTSRGREES